jgi:hypothetical protein
MGNQKEGSVRLHRRLKQSRETQEVVGLNIQESLVYQKLRTSTYPPEIIKLGQELAKIDKIADQKKGRTINDYEIVMTMEMLGNDHVYTHDIHMYPITRNRINLIPYTEGSYDYILKLIVDDRYDMQGTDYIRYHIVKITNPTTADIIGENINDDGHDYFEIQDMLKQLKDIKKPKKPIPPKSPQAKKNYNAKEANEKYNKEKAEYDEKSKERMKVLNEFANKYNYTKMQFTEDIISEKEKADIKPKNIGSVVNRDNTLIFVKRETGRIINYYRKQKVDIEKIIEQQEGKQYDRQLLSKIIAKMLLLPSLDAAGFKGIITYINREKPELDMVDHVLPILTFAIQKLATMETGVLFLTKSKLTNTINDIKNNKYQTMPTNLYDAFTHGRLTEYIGYAIREALSLNTTNNSTPLELGF